MSKYRVLLTDYAWPDLDIERSILEENDIELVLPEGTDEASLVAAASGVDAIMTNWAQVPASVIAAAPECQIVSRLGIGLDNIDVAYCTEHKIVVTNIPDYCLIEVAEHALASLLALGRKVGFYHHETKSGRYDLKAGPTLRRIEGQTLGIVGFGNIGRALAKRALGIGMQVIATSRSGRDPMEGVPWRELDELLAQSDYVSLHVPATSATRHMMGREQFALMKPSAYLINTARGAIVDADALAEALDADQLAGAALDVQDPEPPDLNRPPYNSPKVIVTPHAAFVSEESLEDLRSRTSRQVVARLQGETPESVVNPEVLSS